MDAHKWRGREHLCRSIARPPLPGDRLSETAEGRILDALRRAWRDGTRWLVFALLELLEKLAALVPAPRVHLIHFRGVLAPHAAWRVAIVPRPAAARTAAVLLTAVGARVAAPRTRPGSTGGGNG